MHHLFNPYFITIKSSRMKVFVYIWRHFKSTLDYCKLKNYVDENLKKKREKRSSKFSSYMKILEKSH